MALLCFVARRQNAAPELLDEACSGARERTLRRSAQMIMWAARIESPDRPIPGHFDPATHIASDIARQTARTAIESRLAFGDPTSAQLLRTQLIRLQNDRPLAEVAQSVEHHVDHLLHTRATTSASGKVGIRPDLQLEIVTDLTERLADIGAKPFLMSGTLLGIIRDGGFMAHDYDIDLGLLPTEDIDTVASHLGSVESYEVTTHGDRIVAVHRSGARTDLFPHTARDGKFWHGTLVHEWWNTPFGVEAADVLGQRLWMPSNPELYLDENYGDWQSPAAFYDISFDTPNRVYRQTTDALLHLHSRCVLALNTNDRWLLESSVRELREHFGVDASRFLADSALLRAHRSSG